MSFMQVAATIIDAAIILAMTIGALGVLFGAALALVIFTPRVLCWRFGHIPAEGWGGLGAQYFSARSKRTDALGTEHWDLHATCRWCDKDYRVGKIHGPLREEQ